MNRQRLDSPLVYVGAHNVYYVKLTVKVLYFTIHIHTQINQYVVISEFIKSNKLLVVYLNVEQGKKENTLRIINATNHQLPGDRESLFWVNVKAIPAMEKDQKNENTLQLAIISRIKMFYRPTHLAMAPEEAPAMLRFRRSGSKLTLINPTPYFITVTNMKAGNSNLPNTMVPPKGEVSVDIPHAVTGDISFQTINDYGALTPRIKATMQ